MNKIKERRDEIKEILRQEYEITNIRFSTWVAPLQFYKEENDVVTILVPAEQAHLIEYIQKNYKLYFQVTISQLMEHDYEVAFIAENEATASDNSVNDSSSLSKKVSNVNNENANQNNK